MTAIMLAALTGCGFSPLYGERSVAGGPAVTDAMRQIVIRPLPDREGQKLRQILREQLQPRGMVDQPAYDLEVHLTQRIEEIGVRRDATSSRANYILTANFYLNEGSKRLIGDRVQAIASYNILDEQYATVASQEDAENRAIRRVGEEIKLRLAVYFRQRAEKPVALATP
ncbi:MAG: LPS assembly lipoprotein LptE [Rhodospirillaceae bacterium]